ncbi:MAG TPA: 1-deoxy-D-xylulose-5-phosphate reductoisomerase [Candidatus Limnocylindrales bacterium]|nr:1-deoxy-D-xylulose-5-phosphate reductoisomerase [Candidatus Limnocylindrales bacterium]
MTAADPSPTIEGPTRVAVLGSTGSIGRQALDVLAGLPGAYEVVALAAGRDARALAEQVGRLRPRAVGLADRAALARLDLPQDTESVDSDHALTDIATREDVDLVVIATGGIVSLRPVIAALEAGKIVAIANKETLVAGGHLVMPIARARAAEVASVDRKDPHASPLAWVRPIDSEHSAIWQCLVGEDLSTLERIVLTASGGPFRDAEPERLATVGPAEALAHPTWRMGAKVTIDSATLMNKGLEIVEAHWLYDVPYERIDVVVHPQSIVHSLVEFADGSVKAQLGLPDMRLPIQYAITYPARRPSPAPRLNLAEVRSLSFEAPDETRFPALRIAREAGRTGQRATAALICADEVAVSHFLDGSLDFPGISRLVEEAVGRFGGAQGEPAPDLDELEALEGEVRAWCGTAPMAAG